MSGTSENIPGEDWLFGSLIRVSHDVPDFGLSVTVSIPGAVLTGTLIGPQEFFEQYGKLWKQGFLNRGDAAAGAKIEEVWGRLGMNPNPDDPSSQHSYDYFHMKNVRVLVAGLAKPGPTGMLWRGRVSLVSGFAVGELTSA
jgi:hypothetical protein